MREKLLTRKMLLTAAALFVFAVASCNRTNPEPILPTANPQITEAIEAMPATNHQTPEASNVPTAAATTDESTPPALLDMVFVEGGAFNFHGRQVDVGSFYISRYQLTTNAVHRLETWAIANRMHTGRLFDLLSGNSPTSATWFNALYISNLLSLYHGYRPVYYLDSELTIPLDRNAILGVPIIVFETALHTGIFEDYALLNFYIDNTADGFRLPTEMEWEFAALGGNKSRGFLYAGSDALEDVARIDIDLMSGYLEVIGEAVGFRVRNELGLYGMSGNVREWCIDYWSEEPLIDDALREGVFFFDSNRLPEYRVIKGGFTVQLAMEYGDSVTDFLRPSARPKMNLFRDTFSEHNDSEGNLVGYIAMRIMGNYAGIRLVRRRSG